ncbi:alcohol dehydrogenase catalytic domain-containing protein [Oricola thermophila]|uniref:Alcohol dehydrogenase catalytic domain-containing protein n=1 Tax=Oricola thermophila TaxID=2742145 RepID=A0A6N1VFE0_9HYPH|nr:zinc-binding dehydrogenase [Oricola thermophila]QKV18305.1 alcohol dehydrogenase catalytic domain-containing protein [Oricola thermophila]
MPQAIRAAVCRLFGEPLSVESVQLADPVRDEVLVALESCAICHSDIMAISGRWKGKLPAVFGHEAVGRIEAVGEAVTGLSAGDRVVLSLIRFCGRCYYCQKGDLAFCEAEFGLASRSPLTLSDGTPVVHGMKVGAFAEKAVVHQSQCVPVDERLDGDIACTLSCGVMTGFGAVANTAEVAAGSSALVIGAGGVGINCVQGAALAGATPVIALDIHDEKLEISRRFGATHAFRADMDGASLAAEVKALTHGRGVDFAFVAVGHPPAIQQAVDLTRDGGQVIVAGIPGRDDIAEIIARTFGGRGISILGSKMGSARPHVDVPRLVDLHHAGHMHLDELVARRFRLDDINEALDLVRSGRELKCVIEFGGDA